MLIGLMSMSTAPPILRQHAAAAQRMERRALRGICFPAT